MRGHDVCRRSFLARLTTLPAARHVSLTVVTWLTFHHCLFVFTVLLLLHDVACQVVSPDVNAVETSHVVSSPRLVRVYTVASMDSVPKSRVSDGVICRADCVARGGDSVGWKPILTHFLTSLRASPCDLEVHTLRFNTSSVSRMAAVGAQSVEHGTVKVDIPGSGSIEVPHRRWLSWHVAMLFKAETWARIAGAKENAGKTVLCADIDHTFFPGWRTVVESCVARHEICFEAVNGIVGTAKECTEAARDPPIGTPGSEFWKNFWINTGFFAMRCGPTTRDFWLKVVQGMRMSFSARRAVSDQNWAIFILQRSSMNWGILDPYAANQLFFAMIWRSPLCSNRRPDWRTSHAKRMLDEMVLHHASVAGWRGCSATSDTDSCKLRLMRLVNQTWFARRSSAYARGIG
eukprot:TRINITY_DN48796_c0_g1_i1.p1 TRINITY_DN48796_c0_g1~~TRINITY_DN48796_c0_g1_i1.p1  ORF type:complete len:404 (-),score=43.48 TRINITY_DN48796_c0_g1_i1:208-1419(-)